MKNFSLIFSLVFFCSISGFSQEIKKIITVNSSSAKLTEGEKTTSKVLKTLGKGEKLELLEILFPSGIANTSRFKVNYLGVQGYITSYFIYPEFEMDGQTSSLKELEIIEIEKIQIRNKLIDDSIKEQRIVDAERKLANQKIDEEAEIRRNDSIAAIMFAKAKEDSKEKINEIRKRDEAAIAERKVRFVKKYGASAGEKIAKGLIWIGMTEEMLIDSWGRPNDINTTTTRYSVKKQYVYSNRQYVYVENGIVDAWQN